jgi:broad specificity phosphatase PhoE
LVDDDDSSHHAAASESSQDAVIDPSKVKVSIDYGLSELMNGKAIRNPPRGLVDSSTELHWTVPLEELHALLPTGSLDNSVQPTLSAVPAWGETTSAGHQRYSDIFQSIADKFSGENVLCISHGKIVCCRCHSFFLMKSTCALLLLHHLYGSRWCPLETWKDCVLSRRPKMLTSDLHL